MAQPVVELWTAAGPLAESLGDRCNRSRINGNSVCTCRSIAPANDLEKYSRHSGSSTRPRRDHPAVMVWRRKSVQRADLLPHHRLAYSRPR
jgi:hypothetical protein